MFELRIALRTPVKSLQAFPVHNRRPSKESDGLKS